MWTPWHSWLVYEAWDDDGPGVVCVTGEGPPAAGEVVRIDPANVPTGDPVALPAYTGDPGGGVPPDSVAAWLACARVLHEAMAEAGVSPMTSGTGIEAPFGYGAALSVTIAESEKLPALAQALDRGLGVKGSATVSEVPGPSVEQAGGYWLTLDYDLPTSIGRVHSYPLEGAENETRSPGARTDRLVIGCYARELTDDLNTLVNERAG